MKKVTISIGFILGLQICAFSQSIRENIEQYFQNFYENGVAPGFSVVVVKDQEVLLQKGYGLAYMDRSRKMNAQTASAIGSLTKSFTVMAIMQLVEQGKLKLDLPLINYLPEFRSANKARSDMITVRMLLNNTSGLMGEVNKSGSISNASLESFMDNLAASYLTKEPGSSFAYSNSAFAVAGLLISRVSGLNYPDYLQANIFEPLEMKRTSTLPEVYKAIDALNGHHFGLKKGIPAQASQRESGEMMAAGSLLRSTAEDLGHYLIALLNEGKYKNRQILRQESIQAMWKKEINFPGLPIDQGGEGRDYYYGLGWMLSSIDGREVIHHGGSTGSMSSFTILDPQKKYAASILLNIDYNFINKYQYLPVEHIMNNVLHLLHEDPPTKFGIPRVGDPSINTYELPKAWEDRYVGKYRFLEGGDAWYFNGVNVEILKERTGELMGKVFRGQELISHFKLDFVNPSLVMARYIGMPSALRFKINPKGQVLHLYFRGTSFRKMPEDFYENYHKISLRDGSASFHLPKAWYVQQQKNGWLQVLKGENEDFPQLMMKWIDGQYSTSYQLLKDLFPEHKTIKTGLSYNDETNQQFWQEQSFITQHEDRLYQHYLLVNKQADKNLYAMLSCPYGTFTEELQAFAQEFKESYE